jgi:cytochrome c553
MKTSTLLASVPLLAFALALAACQHAGTSGADQGAVLAGQNRDGGPANALGIPGASAAHAGGAPDLQAGAQLAARGAPNGVAACVTCHGAQGEGDAAGGYPRIAGQSQAYLGTQLGAYANDARVNPVMQPIAKAMSAEQIRDVSAWYASLAGAPAGASTGASTGAAGPKPPDAGMARGRLLSEAGDASLGVQACASCHGPGGAGRQPDFPYLAGQHASYLTAAMRAWKSGARKTDGSGQMPHIARALADADVAALSNYFAAQPAPAKR